MPLRERQEVEEMSRSAGVAAAKLKPTAEQLCLCLQRIRHTGLSAVYEAAS
jgi:hypothetical protein